MRDGSSSPDALSFSIGSDASMLQKSAAEHEQRCNQVIAVNPFRAESVSMRNISYVRLTHVLFKPKACQHNFCVSISEQSAIGTSVQCQAYDAVAGRHAV